jgi:uncharacterized UBP type Zn finger protein
MFTSKLFQLTTQLLLTCTSCGHKTTPREESHSNFEIGVYDSVEEGLDVWFKSDFLIGYKCDCCGATDKSLSSTVIKESPEVLVINIKRQFLSLN